MYVFPLDEHASAGASTEGRGRHNDHDSVMAEAGSQAGDEPQGEETEADHGRSQASLASLDLHHGSAPVTQGNVEPGPEPGPSLTTSVRPEMQVSVEEDEDVHQDDLKPEPSLVSPGQVITRLMQPKAKKKSMSQANVDKPDNNGDNEDSGVEEQVPLTDDDRQDASAPPQPDVEAGAGKKEVSEFFSKDIS